MSCRPQLLMFKSLIPDSSLFERVADLMSCRPTGISRRRTSGQRYRHRDWRQACYLDVLPGAASAYGVIVTVTGVKPAILMSCRPTGIRGRSKRPPPRRGRSLLGRGVTAARPPGLPAGPQPRVSTVSAGAATRTGSPVSRRLGVRSSRETQSDSDATQSGRQVTAGCRSGSWTRRRLRPATPCRVPSAALTADDSDGDMKRRSEHGSSNDSDGPRNDSDGVWS